MDVICPSRTRHQPYTTLISTCIPVVAIKRRIGLSADDIPPAPHNTPERSVTSQASSSPEQNVLRPTLSPVVSPTAQSPTPSLQPAQQSRPRAPSPVSSTGSAAAAAPGDLEYMRDKLKRTTRHLVWLASTVARLPNFHPDRSLGEFARELNTALAAPPTEPDINFRRELETDFPLTQDNPRTVGHSDCKITSAGIRVLELRS